MHGKAQPENTSLGGFQLLSGPKNCSKASAIETKMLLFDAKHRILSVKMNKHVQLASGTATAQYTGHYPYGSVQQLGVLLKQIYKGT